MPAHRRRTAAVIAATLGTAPLALPATPASAHGSMGDPVSRVAQCYAEGPESPASAACRAAVAAGGTQALYDWNGVRIAEAGGRHQALIPDGELCGAGNEAFKGLDLVRADWPATAVRSGSYTFRYRVTAPHRGTFVVYLTKEGYDPAEPLAWADLDLEHPVATAVDPAATGGFHTFSGTLPQRSGRQLLYAIWQRSDSPEAFYSCSDVAFGAGAAPSSAASTPSGEQIEAGADESTVEHAGHSAEPDPGPEATGPVTPPTPAGAVANLAETGGASGAPYLVAGGAGASAVGAAVLLLSVRRRRH